jgi:hypothetical protein
MPQQQQVVFDDDADLHHVLERAQHTTLTRWMDFNQSARERHSRQPAGTPLPECLTTTYDRFPSIATWDNASRTWHARRGGGSVVGRVYFVPPSAGERYYLRMLLHHVPGCTSFEDLRTTPTSATPHASYQGACDARGLLATDSQRERCLAEAVSYQMPYQLRQLFATMLAHDTPARPMQLWQRFQASMTEDYLHKAQQVGHQHLPPTAATCCHYLPPAAAYLCTCHLQLLPAATCCHHLAPAATTCYHMPPTTNTTCCHFRPTRCHQLLPLTCCHYLLPYAACCHLPPATTCHLPPATICHLPSPAFTCLHLPSPACCHLLPPAATYCHLPTLTNT